MPRGWRHPISQIEESCVTLTGEIVVSQLVLKLLCADGAVLNFVALCCLKAAEHVDPKFLYPPGVKTEERGEHEQHGGQVDDEQYSHLTANIVIIDQMRNGRKDKRSYSRIERTKENPIQRKQRLPAMKTCAELVWARQLR